MNLVPLKETNSWMVWGHSISRSHLSHQLIVQTQPTEGAGAGRERLPAGAGAGGGLRARRPFSALGRRSGPRSPETPKRDMVGGSEVPPVQTMGYLGPPARCPFSPAFWVGRVPLQK